MKRIITWVAGLLTLIIGISSAAQQKATPKDKSLLWRISGKKLGAPSYVFGTIHLICPEDYVWTDKMKETFSKSEKICFEMNLNDPGLMTEVASGMIDTSGKKLADYFTEEQYNLLKTYIKDSLGMDMAMLEGMKPVMLESIISTGSSGCQNPVSYEDSLMKTALTDRKEIIGLESAAEQLGVLGTIPIDTVIKALMDEIQNHGGNDSEYNNLIAAYKKQDLPALYALLINSKDLGADMGTFLDDRNKKWISRMTEKMQHSSVFFAVGAGHLWGDNGVIALLRKAGYTIEPLK